MPVPHHSARRRAVIALVVGVVLLLPTSAIASATADDPESPQPSGLQIPQLPGSTPAAEPKIPAPADGELAVGAPETAVPQPAGRPRMAEGYLAAKAERGTVFATVAGQDLVLPNTAIAVGFHEASRRALTLTPVGTPTHNHNARRVTLPSASAENRYLVLPTRRRNAPATSAADIRIEHGLPITSVVDGTVTEVSDYALYGRTPDMLVEIQSTKNPELRIRMLHIEDVRVQPGDVVVAGRTVIAGSSRQLPFASQIDRFSSRGPHVHVEVRHHPKD